MLMNACVISLRVPAVSLEEKALHSSSAAVTALVAGLEAHLLVGMTFAPPASSSLFSPDILFLSANSRTLHPRNAPQLASLS